jgi:hypothetical protein
MSDSELENTNINVRGLVERLQIRFPNHDFTKSQPLDTRCKKSFDGKCKIVKHLTYATDMDGNDFCIERIKIRDDNNPYLHKEIVCNAIIRSAEQKRLAKKGGF